MLIAGIIGQDDKCKTANLINSLFSSTGKKVSIVDSGDLIGLDSLLIKDYLSELQNNNTKILLLKINILDIEKKIFDFLNFDIIIYTDKVENLKENGYINYSAVMRRISSLLDEKGIVIVNVDDGELIRLLEGMKYYIVTYGFNSKASITTSSIGDTVSHKDNFMCCLQRTISAKNGVLVEPQEYSIKVESNEFDAYSVLAAATFAIVNGIDLNSVNQ